MTGVRPITSSIRKTSRRRCTGIAISFAGLDLNTATIRVTEPDGKSALHPVIKNRMWFLPKDLTHQEMSTTDPGRHTVVIDIKDKHGTQATNTTGLPADKYANYQNKVVEQRPGRHLGLCMVARS